MARSIYCEECNKKVASDAKKFDELYESIEGIAIVDMFCDGFCGSDTATPIKKGDKCFASVLLNSKNHPNYEFQKPENWANEYLEIKS